MKAPAASHHPVLKALGQSLGIRRVVEYGCGLYSTLLFLDRELFPSVTEVLSYEDAQEWIDRVRKMTPDQRLRFQTVFPGRFSMLPFPAGYDLAFVDSSTADSRVALLYTIRLHPLVVLHDYNGPQCYRDAAALWSNRFVYEGLHPHTGVFWHDSLPPEWLRVLENLGSIVR